MQKIKQFVASEQGKDVLTILIVILVGLGSFELGRLSKAQNSSSGVKIEYGSQTPAEAAGSLPPIATNPTKKTFFASSRGSKYYSLDCSGGKTIKMENRIYFTTAREAEQAGYELSSTCR